MTTTIVYGDVSDGYLNSGDATYAGARNGPADGANAGTSAFYGQNNNGGTYTVFQTFIRFAYPAVAAGDVVTSAVVQTYQLSQLSTGTVRDLEIRGAPWSGGGLTVADWQTPAALAASGVYGMVRGVQASQGKWTSAGSEALRAFVKGNTGAEFVLVSSRQRAGSTPTTDEGASIATADQSGTSSDPRLVFTTVPDSRLIPVMGAEAQLSDGSWAFLTMDGATGTVTLWREDLAALAFNLGNHVTGTGAGDWYNVPAAQGLTLTVDTLDNIYVVGRAGDAPNSIRVRAYVKAPGSWSWSAGAIRTAALPAHDSPVNNVTCAWSPAAGGTLLVFASHAAGEGVSGGDANDVVWVAFDSVYLRDGTGGTLVRGSGSAQAAGILSSAAPSGHFSGYLNETGSGLDLAQDSVQTDWGYVISFRRDQAMGGNSSLQVGRFNLNSTATGFDFAESTSISAYGTKDASAKARVISVGSAQVAVVTADADAGWGLSVQVLQSSGDVGGLVSLGYVHLAGESIPSMPDGPAVKASLAWDAIYSPAENAVWVYYVDKSNPSRLMRTSVDMNTYQATRAEVQVLTTPGNTIQAVRAPRNAWPSGGLSHVTVAHTGGFVRGVDLLNLPPLAPALTARANYDATVAATFAWTFRDPNAGDTQSAYQLQVVRVSDGVTVLDTGKVLSVTTSRSVAGGTLANGVDYRWRVMTWDQSGLASPWSDYGTFTTSASGSVTITDPATNNAPGIATNDYQVAWSVAGTVQAKFRAWATRNDTGATVYDSGWLTDAFQGRYVRNMVSDVEHTIRVQVENASGIQSGIGTRLITPSYGSPEIPLATVTPSVEGGYVLVGVENPEPGDLGAPLWDFEALVPSFADPFARDTAGGWGSGYVRVSGAAAAFSTSLAASRATITLATKAEHLIQLPPASVADVDLMVTLESPDMTPDAGSNNPNFLVDLRYVDGNNYLRFKVWMTSGSSMTASVERREAGVTTVTAFPLISGATLNSRVRLRVQAIGSVTRMKVWLATQPQPAAWIHEVATTHLAAGLARMGANVPPTYSGTVPKTFHFSDLVINGVDSSKTARDWGKAGVTTTPDSTGGEFGDGAMKMTATASGLVYTRAPAFPVTPGERYVVRGRVMRPAGGVARVFLEFWRSDGSLISSAAVDTTTAAGVWQDVASNGKAPADATQAVYGPALPTAVAGDVVQVDNLQLTYASDRPGVVRNRIFRRPVGSTGDWEVLGECEPDGSFRDYTVPSHVPVEYLVRGESA